MLSVLFIPVGAPLRLPYYISEVAVASRLCNSNPCECRPVLHDELDVLGNLSADYGQFGWKTCFDCFAEERFFVNIQSLPWFKYAEYQTILQNHHFFYHLIPVLLKWFFSTILAHSNNSMVNLREILCLLQLKHWKE